ATADLTWDTNHEKEEIDRHRAARTIRLRRPRARAARESAARHHDVARDAARGAALLGSEEALLADRRQPESSSRRPPGGRVGRSVEGIREPSSADAVPAVTRRTPALPGLPRRARARDPRCDAKSGAARRSPARPAARIPACLTGRDSSAPLRARTSHNARKTLGETLVEATR